MILSGLRHFGRTCLVRLLAALPDRRGVRLLLKLSDRVGGLTLSVIKLIEGNLHPKHRITDLHRFFVEATPAGARVLDVGCAYGNIARAVAEKADSVLAVDIREYAIERARAENPHPRVTYRIEAFEQFASAGPFDIIVASNVLEHIVDRKRFLAKCVALAPVIALRVPAIDRDWMVAYRRELGLSWKLHPDHDVEYTAETLTDELERAGYRVEQLFAKYGALHCIARHEVDESTPTREDR